MSLFGSLPFLIGDSIRNGSAKTVTDNAVAGLASGYVNAKNAGLSNNAAAWSGATAATKGVVSGVGKVTSPLFQLASTSAKDAIVGAKAGLGLSAPKAAAPTAGAPAAAAPVDYKYADLAQHYGMSAETAYQEALSNTAYQRMVQDLQAAGLNPVLATGRSGASSNIYGELAGQSVGSFSPSAPTSGKNMTGALTALGAVLDLFGVTKGIGSKGLGTIGKFIDSL